MRVSRIRDPILFNYLLTGEVLREVMNANWVGVVDVVCPFEPSSSLIQVFWV